MVGVRGRVAVRAPDRGRAGRRRGPRALCRRLGRGRPALGWTAGLEEDEVPAARGAGQQHPFQCHAAQQAAGEPGADRRQAGGAEELGDVAEPAGGGAAVERFRQVEGVADEDVEDVEEVGDVLRQRLGGPGLSGAGAGRGCGGVGRCVHGLCF